MKLSFLLVLISIFSSVTVCEGTDKLKILFKAPVGSGDGKIAYGDKVVGCCGYRRSPGGFAVSAGGEFYILDDIGNKIEVFNHEGTHQRTLRLPADLPHNVARPRQIIIGQDSTVYILTTENNDLTRNLITLRGGVFTISKGLSANELSFNRLNRPVLRGPENRLNNPYETDLLSGDTNDLDELVPALKVSLTKTDSAYHFIFSDQIIDVRTQYQSLGSVSVLQKTPLDEQLFKVEDLKYPDILRVESRIEAYKDGHLSRTATLVPDRSSNQWEPYGSYYISSNGHLYEMILGESSVILVEIYLNSEEL